MQTLLIFVFEQSLLNVFVMLIGVAAASLLLGSYLSGRRTHPLLRSAIYAAIGTGVGIWNYIGHDKEPATQHLTVPILAASFFILLFALAFPFVYFNGKRQRPQLKDADSGA